MSLSTQTVCAESLELRTRSFKCKAPWTSLGKGSSESSLSY